MMNHAQTETASLERTGLAAHQVPQHSLSIRLLNRLGSVLEQVGISLANRSEDSLMAAARRKTSLSDWGDESFRIPLQVLLESYRKDAKLNITGWLEIHELLIRSLSNRLRIQDELKRHPGILQEQIRRPLFIVSLPRTGTSLLQALLSQDTSNRSLLFWEAISPSPPPEPHTRETDPRIAKAEKVLQKRHRKWPGTDLIHKTHAKGSHECFPLFLNSFSFIFFHVGANITRYSEWIREQDMVPVYQYYHQQLQLLQSHFPTDRWLLKMPWHMYYLDILLTVFPDSCAVQTHRDLTKVIPSICSLVTTVRRQHSDYVDSQAVGQEFFREIEIMTESSTRARDTIDSNRFFDVLYKDIVKDPIGTVRQIYKHFGYEYDSRFEDRMHKWLAANPQHKHGVHRYSLEQFGLNADMVNRHFAKYCDQFQISPE